MQGLWDHFEIIDSKFSKCTLCNAKLSRGSNNANIFFGHLQHKHPDKWSNMFETPKTIVEKSKTASKKSEESESKEVLIPNNNKKEKQIRNHHHKKQAAKKGETQKQINTENTSKLQGVQSEDDDSVEMKQIVNLLCKKSAKETLIKNSVSSSVIATTTGMNQKLEKNPENRTDMALEWKDFNIRLEILDEDFHGNTDEFEIYPDMSKFMLWCENLKRKYPIGST